MAEEPKDLLSLANMRWWELYQDEELPRLIRIALDENKDLKRVIASIDEFQARLYMARMDFAPQLSATGNLPVARLGAWRSRIMSFGNLTCGWRSPSVRCWHGRSR